MAGQLPVEPPGEQLSVPGLALVHVEGEDPAVVEVEDLLGMEVDEDQMETEDPGLQGLLESLDHRDPRDQGIYVYNFPGISTKWPPV